MNFKKRYLALLLLLSQVSFSQEGMAVYSDYLSDNYYLIHPSMAGAANCAKVRATARQQWMDQDNAPALQTLSFNTAVGERSGVGVIAFNDKNGYHSQTGFKLTYAHHIRFSRNDIDLNMLSFGASAGLIQSRLDEREFLQSWGDPFDPIIDGGITQKYSYLAVDLGASYHYMDFYSHLTVKNAVESDRKIYTDVEPDNLRKYLLTLGYVFGRSESVQWEPSVMFQMVDQTKEKTVDLNLKLYKNFDFGKVWGGLSYRRSFDGAEYTNAIKVEEQRYQALSPILGVNYKNFMIAYTHTQVFGDVKFATGGYHQLTIGLNLFCKREKWDCNCPAVN